MDDQAETVLMNLITGAGLQGLGGVDWVRPLTEAPPGRPVALVRPLLGVRRAQILAYLAGYGLSCREDATNQDQTRLRNHIRHAALPLLAEINPQIVPTLARTAGILAAEAERTTSLDRNSLRALCLAADPTAGRIVLDVAKFRVLDLAAQRRTAPGRRPAWAGLAQYGFGARRAAHGTSAQATSAAGRTPSSPAGP